MADSFDPFFNLILTGNPLRSTNPPTYDPFFNSISTVALANRPIHPRAKKQRIANDIRVSDAIKFAVDLLEDDFRQHQIASQEFPPEILPHIFDLLSVDIRMRCPPHLRG
jgi:hypothetical protein